MCVLTTSKSPHTEAVAHAPRPVEGGLLEKNIAQIYPTRPNFDEDEEFKDLHVISRPHRPDIYDFRSGLDTTKNTTHRAAVAHAPRPVGAVFFR